MLQETTQQQIFDMALEYIKDMIIYLQDQPFDIDPVDVAELIEQYRAVILKNWGGNGAFKNNCCLLCGKDLNKEDLEDG